MEEVILIVSSILVLFVIMAVIIFKRTMSKDPIIKSGGSRCPEQIMNVYTLWRNAYVWWRSIENTLIIASIIFSLSAIYFSVYSKGSLYVVVSSLLSAFTTSVNHFLDSRTKAVSFRKAYVQIEHGIIKYEMNAASDIELVDCFDQAESSIYM